ncbi:MAG: hypothetical protein ACREN5_10710, partial [Gemmatimonadales bacterium]
DRAIVPFPAPSADLAHRRALLTAALGFGLLDSSGQPALPEVQTVRTWLDNGQGVLLCSKSARGIRD